jgi:hypothetical protein
MDPIKDEARGGINDFIHEQKKIPGAANLSIVLFSAGANWLEKVMWRRPIQEATELTEKDYAPSGMTKLNDAVGACMTDLGKELDAIPEADRPSKVMVAIQTDGFENSSELFSTDQIKAMIQHQRDVYSWLTHYLGQHIGAATVARQLGINENMVVQSVASPEGTHHLYEALSYSAIAYRTGATPIQLGRKEIDPNLQEI